MKIGSLAILALSMPLAGCMSTTDDTGVPRGTAAYQAIESVVVPAPDSYTMMDSDVISVSVFGEPDVSREKVIVDTAGNVQIPLVGEIKAKGLTFEQLTQIITQRLGEKYIRDPKVTIALVEPAPRYVSVEGEVNKPGVYEIGRNSTLLAALARAESPSLTAKLSQVIILRQIDGQDAIGRFDVSAIRGGQAPNPQILDGDVVMVGYSRPKGIYQDVLRAAPIFNAFVMLSGARN